MYLDAKTRAEEMDRVFWESSDVVGLLHDLQISVKDQCRVEGTETTCGFVANLGVRDEVDCLLVEILRGEGALVFVKTSCSMGFVFLLMVRVGCWLILRF